MRTRDLMLLASLLCGACTAVKDDFDSGSDSAVADSTFETENPEDSGGDEVEPALVELGASFSIVDGQAVPDDASVTWTLLDASKERICSLVASIDTVVAVEPLPDDSFFAAWTFTIGVSDGGCRRYEDELAPSLELALGPIYPDLLPLMEIAGYEDLEDSLYGVYTSEDNWADTIWAFGIAGTVEGFLGEQLAVEQAPLPDGLYTLIPVYTLPF